MKSEKFILACNLLYNDSALISKFSYTRNSRWLPRKNAQKALIINEKKKRSLG